MTGRKGSKPEARLGSGGQGDVTKVLPLRLKAGPSQGRAKSRRHQIGSAAAAAAAGRLSEEDRAKAALYWC